MLEEKKELILKIEASLQFAYRFQEGRSVNVKALGYKLQNWQSILNNALRGWDKFAEIRETISTEDRNYNLELRLLHDDCEKLLEDFTQLEKSLIMRKIAVLRMKRVSWFKILSDLPSRYRRSMKQDYYVILLEFYHQNETAIDLIFQHVELSSHQRKPRRT